ncbi:hypothetical protein [Leptospira perdikensis]|uniref:Lipoprotein n=1 Tax=Leptospira perdikensis TaxID=2484948 RepID=A0A4R9JKG9_9LEPT|nr:hypothetical protein [Leptospira perdikensis]TGL45200.1 hypothetical protein EHQ49_07030 [Leptospira perdikensis]
MENLKLSIKTIHFSLILLLLTTIMSSLSCKDSQESGLIPLSLISIAKEVEEQNRLNQCMGTVPGQTCITIVEHHPANIRKVELLHGVNQISVSDATGVPITDAMCYVYYNIDWGNDAPYRSTKIYLKNTNGEICGIGWEKKEGGTIDQLLNLFDTERQLTTVTEINANGMKLKFYR